jgi:hypothetical protein
MMANQREQVGGVGPVAAQEPWQVDHASFVQSDHHASRPEAH